MKKRLIESKRIRKGKRMFTNRFEVLVKELEPIPNWDEGITLQFIRDADIDDNGHARQALSDGNNTNAIAGTYIELLVRSEHVDDPDVKVSRVRAIIYVPISTIRRISDRCNPVTDVIHAYDTIIRHEIGHVMDAYHQYYGCLLSKASDDAMERFVYSKLEVMSVADKLGGELDRCLYINKYAPAEAAANEYGGVQTEDLVRLYNTVTRIYYKYTIEPLIDKLRGMIK